MRQHLARFLVILLLALWGSGTWVSGICECTHGPEVECECPHHQGDAEDESLPPCHRAAAAGKKRGLEDAPPGSSFKSQCGARPPAFVQLPPAELPPVDLGPPERVALPSARWTLEVRAPDSVEEKIEPPPPRRS
ncbi:MAG: hypothetical protein M3Y59_09020 [Myxococcota bacterium]|nr:hypothetical protein [Myxococcota bacterium]